MKYLKEIIMPENGENNQCIAIFYTACQKSGSMVNGKLETHLENESNHCEMFPKSSVTGIVLNDRSFCIRLGSRSLLLTLTDERQIKQLAGFAEHTIGKGLKVIQHYDNMDIKEKLKKTDS